MNIIVPVFAIPVIVLIVFVFLILLIELLDDAIFYCGRTQCGPLEFALLQLISKFLQILYIPILLLLVVVEFILVFILTILKALVSAIDFLLGEPVAVIVLILAVATIIVFLSNNVGDADNGGGNETNKTV